MRRLTWIERASRAHKERQSDHRPERVVRIVAARVVVGADDYADVPVRDVVGGPSFTRRGSGVPGS